MLSTFKAFIVKSVMTTRRALFASTRRFTTSVTNRLKSVPPTEKMTNHTTGFSEPNAGNVKSARKCAVERRS